MIVVLAAVFALRLTFGAYAPPSFHNYGTIETTFGTAAVVCGGEGGPGGCGANTKLVVQTCTHAYFDYFNASDPVRVDQLVRQLTGKRPPSGNRWLVECGGADAMIQGQPPAQLASL